MKPSFKVYSDFNCPFCYGLNERLLKHKNEIIVQWKGVQHAPQLSIPLAEASPALAYELEREVSLFANIAPEIPIQLPIGKPNTALAILAVSATMVESPEKAETFKNRLYRDFWVMGIDISNEHYLRKTAKEEGLSDQFRFNDQKESSKQWHTEWFQSGLGSVPALIRSDGKILMGLAGERELNEFLAGTS